MGLEESSATIIFLVLQGRGVSFVTLNFFTFFSLHGKTDVFSLNFVICLI